MALQTSVSFARNKVCFAVDFSATLEDLRSERNPNVTTNQAIMINHEALDQLFLDWIEYCKFTLTILDIFINCSNVHYIFIDVNYGNEDNLREEYDPDQMRENLVDDRLDEVVRIERRIRELVAGR